MTQTNKERRVTGEKSGAGTRSGSGGKAKSNSEMPGWTNGLRQLYDQVVDEDLPDSFHDLLARLDDKT